APKVDVHAIWEGKGEQLLVTLIEARKDERSRISKIEPLGGDALHGFRATLADGRVLTYQAALNEAPLKAESITLRGSVLLTLADAAGATRGIALDARDWSADGRRVQVRNFEFALRAGNLVDVQEIRYPEGALPRQPGLAGILAPDRDLGRGLVARWSFDVLANDTVLDVSGHAHDGTVTGGKLVPGIQGQAIEFGARGSMRVPNHDSLNLTEGFTLYGSARHPGKPPGGPCYAVNASDTKASTGSYLTS
ncbi:MAG: hypothetical protein WCO68_11385, partial [Verrucomicrobiota bacterium]